MAVLLTNFTLVVIYQAELVFQVELFCNDQDAYLLAIDKGTGKIRWQAQLPTVSIEALQATSDIVIVRTNDAEVLAFNINDGTPGLELSNQFHL